MFQNKCIDCFPPPPKLSFLCSPELRIITVTVRGKIHLIVHENHSGLHIHLVINKSRLEMNVTHIKVGIMLGFSKSVT